MTRRRRRRRGFTFVEMLIVMIILGLLAGIALLKYIDLKNEAYSSKVASDMQAIRLAAFNYYAEKEEWPPDANAGVVPPSMQPFLSGGISFTNDRVTYDWDNIEGDPRLLGVVITSTDPKLGPKLIQRLGRQAPYIDLGSAFMYLVISTDGSF